MVPVCQQTWRMLIYFIFFHVSYKIWLYLKHSLCKFFSATGFCNGNSSGAGVFPGPYSTPLLPFRASCGCTSILISSLHIFHTTTKKFTVTVRNFAPLLIYNFFTTFRDSADSQTIVNKQVIKWTEKDLYIR